MKGTEDLFVGVTSWNSADFLRACLTSLRRTAPECEICVFDNMSEDGSAAVARDLGAGVIVRRASQPDALNVLSENSRRPFTLLIHADVVFLAGNWFEIMTSHLDSKVGLVSPEDVGCGDFTRPWGAGMPESSFLLFSTAVLRRLRRTVWRKRWRVPIPGRRIDFDGEHITYRLPGELSRIGSGMFLTNVHPAHLGTDTYFSPPVPFKYWRENWGNRRYGLGNFYSVDGVITHYHNWFDRIGVLDSEDAPEASFPADGGLPVAFVKDYSRRFLADFAAGSIELPEVSRT